MRIKSNFEDSYDNLKYLDKDEERPTIWERFPYRFSANEAFVQALNRLNEDSRVDIISHLMTLGKTQDFSATWFKDQTSLSLPFYVAKMLANLRPRMGFDYRNRATLASLYFCGRHYEFIFSPYANLKKDTFDRGIKRLECVSDCGAGYWGPNFHYMSLPYSDRYDLSAGYPTTYNRRLEEAVNAIPDYDHNIVAAHLAVQSPVFVIIGNNLIINPSLEKIGFVSAHGAPRIWTEISTFLDNEMAVYKIVAPQPISDEMRAETKGFDSKMSFRKGGKKFNREKLDRSKW